ncbi:uracil-xanthine permease family protein [Marinitoga litoralis]|uniref:uracil-xanthine permease family protein n=1 Tax=Marinitoga litoralis TaxID=570855 RepID=UPI00196132F8|nr:uracil-xanthine permease family protein [Marinitoga litoralis]MBM7558429.1 uracil permease [Marinitoga litoralis]
MNEYVDVTLQEDRSEGMSTGGLILLGLQHTFTMFGATVLVPYLTGIPVNVALFTAGLGTLLFHWITNWKVPVFLGSSFAYIAPIIAVTMHYMNEAGLNYGSINDAVAAGVDLRPYLAYATGGIFLAGLVKFGFGILIKFIGIRRFEKLFPPVISGTMIILIGLILSPVAINMASGNWWIALVSLFTAVIVRLYTRGFSRLVPVIWGIIVGYVVAAITGNVSFAEVGTASWVGMPELYLPKFSWYAAAAIIPVAIAPSVEHFGDVFAISAVVGKKFYEDPGMHRTLMGDGLATSLGGFLGGPANTTYSENTGVLAFTKAFNPWIMRIAAFFAILLALIPKVGAIVRSIPVPVMGGIEILLFGMIASIGAKTLINNQVKVEGKNLVTMSLMLVTGLGGAVFQAGNFALQGLGLAAVVGVLTNLILTITGASEY